MLYTTYAEWRCSPAGSSSCEQSDPKTWRVPDVFEVELAVEWAHAHGLIPSYKDDWVFQMMADHLCGQTRNDMGGDTYGRTKSLIYDVVEARGFRVERH